MDRLRDKTAIVVGAGSSGPGISNGRAIALAFAREGAHVICSDLHRATAQETADMITDAGGSATAVPVDTRDSSTIRALVGNVLAAHDHIDIVHHNVGILSSGGVVDCDLAEWREVLETNLTGVVALAEIVLPHMVRTGGGVFNLTSSVVSLGWAGLPHAAYYASKGALDGLMRALAWEYAAKGVRVNSVLPGRMATPMVAAIAKAADVGTADLGEVWRRRGKNIPLGAMGNPWDVAEAAVFAAAPDSRYMTGAQLVVDGGFMLTVDDGLPG